MNHLQDIHAKYHTTNFGFWIYLLSDIMLFGAFFATFMVLRENTAGGVGAQDVFQLPYVLLQTIVLLVSSFTAAIALLAARFGKYRDMRRYLIATLLLGLTFLGLELFEFITMYLEGHSWQESAFLSSFFALVGLHGAHIAAGLIWLGVFLYYLRERAMDEHMMRKLGLFVLFWHFLDLVWIWIFIIVYLFGVSL